MQDASPVTARCPICGSGPVAPELWFCPHKGCRLRFGDGETPRWQVERLLGQGGYGQVYRCRHLSMALTAAVKTLAADDELTDVTLARFNRERDLLGKHHHHLIVRGYDAGAAPTPWVAMELLDGETLRERLGRGPLSVEEAIPIVINIAAVLAHLHPLGIAHRDIKPGNIMLCATGARLLDLGIARVEAEPGVTVGEIPGTPQYLAPEIARGEAGAPSARDVYALGVVFIEMLLGTNPFARRTWQATLLAHVTEPPPIPSDLPTRLADLLARLLSKHPTDRPTAADVVAFFEDQGAVAPVAPTPEVTPEDEDPAPEAAPPGDPAPIRSRLLIALAGATLLTGLLVWALSAGSGDSPAPPDATVEATPIDAAPIDAAVVDAGAPRMMPVGLTEVVRVRAIPAGGVEVLSAVTISSIHAQTPRTSGPLTLQPGQRLLRCNGWPLRAETGLRGCIADFCQTWDPAKGWGPDFATGPALDTSTGTLALAFQCKEMSW